MAVVSSGAALRGADYENGLRGGSSSAGAGQDPGEDDPMGRGGLELDLDLLGPGRRSRRIGGRVATGRRSGGRGSTGSGGAGGLEELEEEEMEEEEPGELSEDPAIEDPELEAIKARVREMEEEAEKLKEMQNEVEKQMNMSPPPGNAGPVIMSIEEKMEADARSIYVGNVDYGATAEELEAHFHGCGSVNRVTILCDKYTGHPKGFAYIEFSDRGSVRTSLALDESLFRGRQIKPQIPRFLFSPSKVPLCSLAWMVSKEEPWKLWQRTRRIHQSERRHCNLDIKVVPKRTNRPGISTTDRGFPRARFRARASSYSSRSRFYSGYPSRPRGRVYRGRARVTSWYSPY